MNHLDYMHRCLELAKLGLVASAPNPSVGAILVYKGQIISEGFTSAFGGAHAEVNCINNVEENNKHLICESTLYVSLEPCSHHGKTPPCSSLIIAHKIPKVVVATSDPNPLVAGKGMQQLQDAGIDVVSGILEKEARELNKRFITFHTQKRPYIILKWAQTPQGFFAPNNNEQFWITNKKTKALVHSWRAQEMGILVGANTVIADNPRLNTRLVAGNNPIRIIINSGEALPENLHVFNDGNKTILFSNTDKVPNEVVTVIPLPKENSLNYILEELYTRGINSLLVEGGAFTLQEFIKENLWDESRILIGEKELSEGVVAPKITGELVTQFSVVNDQINVYKNKI